jgi:hypothetical protein
MPTQMCLDLTPAVATTAVPLDDDASTQAQPDSLDDAAPSAEPRVNASIASHLAQRSFYASQAEHQGISHQAALPEVQLLELMRRLRASIESRMDHAQSVVNLTSLLCGFPPDLAARLPLGPADGNAHAAVLDTTWGVVVIDYGQILLMGSAAVPENGVARPATRRLIKPLPRFLVAALRELHRANPTARSLGEMCSHESLAKGQPLDDQRFGFLRATSARTLKGIAAFALRLGIDRYHAALCATAPELCGHARLFYIRSNSEHYLLDLNRLYGGLGLGPANATHIEVDFGSAVVPADRDVRWCFDHLVAQQRAALPGRRYTLATLIQFHNTCVTAWGFLFAFVLGLRESRVMDFCASRCRPGLRLMEVADKRADEFKRMHPVMLGDVARTQVALVWSHLQELQRRAKALGVPASTPWMVRLRKALQHERTALLFRIDSSQAIPLGTADFQHAVPPERRMVANAGRHYWQTHFYEIGLSTSDIDRWARHSPAGRQTATAQDTVIFDDVAARLLAMQGRQLNELGLSAIAGLSKRAMT